MYENFMVGEGPLYWGTYPSPVYSNGHSLVPKTSDSLDSNLGSLW